MPPLICNLISFCVATFDVLSFKPNGSAVLFNLYFRPDEVILVLLSKPYREIVSPIIVLSLIDLLTEIKNDLSETKLIFM